MTRAVMVEGRCDSEERAYLHPTATAEQLLYGSSNSCDCLTFVIPSDVN
jgi:hypothetical protein